MHLVTDTSELWKGLSDIPLALLAGIFAFSLRRSPAASGRRHTALFFASIGLSSLAGIVLHCFDFTRRQLDCGWTFLYLLLYFCLWLFYGEMGHLLTLKKMGVGAADLSWQEASSAAQSLQGASSAVQPLQGASSVAQPQQDTSASEFSAPHGPFRPAVPSPRAAAIFFALAYAVTVIILYIFEGPDIFVFAAAALVMAVPLVSLAIKNRPLPEGFGLLFLFLLAAVCCQFFSEVVPFIVAGEHLFICAALCCLYRILR